MTDLQKELEALIKLLEDEDRQVYESVSSRLIDLGVQALPLLERRWETTLHPDLQDRIEQVVRRIQFNSVLDEMTAWKTAGGADLLYGAYLVARVHYPDLVYGELEKAVEKIRRDIWLELNNGLTAMEKVRVINYFLYDIHSFRRSRKKGHAPYLYLINHLLDTRKGSPVLLGLIYTEVARRLELPIYGVNLPRNFVLCYYDQEYLEDTNGILFYINPSDRGTLLGLKELKHFLSQLHIEARDFYFRPCSNIDIIERLIINLQFAYDRSGQADRALILRSLLRGDQIL